MQVQGVDGINNKNTNFGAKIVGNYYMRSEARYIAKKGNLEDKCRLLNYLNVIKNDTSFDTFGMEPKTIYDRGHRFCGYVFSLDNGKKVYKDEPFINNSLNWNGDGGDEHFISELGYFIRQHYGKEVYENARDYKPECFQKYLSALKEAHKQLKLGIRDALDLEPVNYLLRGDGTKIPADRLAMPDNDYVC